MAALTESRDTECLPGTLTQMTRIVVDGGRVWQGGMVFAQPVSATITSTNGAMNFTLGIALRDGTGGDAVPVKRGTFRFDSGTGGDEITLADVGSTAYAIDDQTVGKTNGGSTRPKAGIIRDVDSLGVWVEI